MKVYVVKEISTGRYQTSAYEFIKDLRQADLFLTYELAKHLCASDCEVVEVQLMETKDLTDYTKQVRKEVCEEFKENIENIEKSIVNNPSYFDNEERKRLVEKAVYKNVFKFLDKESSK